MRHLALLALLLIALPCHAQILYGLVVGITDGDTVKVLDGEHREHKIRLAGIDTPEGKQPFGQRAKQHLSNFVYGKIVEVEWHKQDRYMRIVGKILMEERDANLEMVRAGLAWHYKKYQSEQSYEDRQTYAQAENEAREHRLGLWADPRPIEPWEWRRGTR